VLEQPTEASIKTWLTLALFALFSAAAAATPSPWWEGKLLDIEPVLPWAAAEAPAEAPEDELLAAPPELAPPEAEAPLEASGSADAPGGSAEVIAAEAGSGSGATARAAAEGSAVAAPSNDEPAPAVLNDPVISDAPPTAAELRQVRPAIAALVAELDRPKSPMERPCTDAACEGHALDRFFAKLTRTALKTTARPVRISQFGDSLVMGDDFAGTVRGRLQKAFGEGGHGFFYIAHPERPYAARGYNVGLSSDWKTRTVVTAGSSNRNFGLAGASFAADGAPSFSARQTDGLLPTTRVGILYHANASRGGFDLAAGEQRTIRDLEVPRGSDGMEWVDLTTPADRFRISRFRGDWLWFGAVAERSGPGVVVDNMGMVSGRVAQMSKIDPAHWARQMAARGTDLASFFYGVNDAAAGNGFASRTDEFERSYRELLRRSRTALPHGDCLAMGILTRGHREGGSVATYPSVGQMTAVQRAVALTEGCAFWSPYESIGGDKGAAAWNNGSPRLLGADLAHPTRSGYVKLGTMLTSALLHAYLAWIDESLGAQP
jgi:lysophospholipase L1-like esterase